MFDAKVLPSDEIVTFDQVRMRVEHKPALLADIARMFSRREVLIDAMVQERSAGGGA